ncbi:MAG: amidohydrolase family protein [Caulobacterales bacterium]
MTVTADLKPASAHPGCPAELQHLAGKILDVDAHEWAPSRLWTDMFGQACQPLAEAEAYAVAAMKDYYFKNSNSYIEETDVIDNYTAWNAKGPFPRAAYDMQARLDLMDYIGVERQVIFPGNFVIISLMMLGQLDNPDFFGSITGDRRGFAMKMIRMHNDWVIRQQQWSNRLRPVATVLGDTVDELYDEAKRVIDAGVRVLWLPVSMLPGGRSPAHSEVDRFWKLCAESNTVCTLHVGNEAAFFKTHEWKNAEFFEADEWKIHSEVNLDPWTLGTWMLPAWNYMTTLIGGGVFDRHPNLRFGLQELGGHWIGALGQGLDLWGEFTQTKPWSTKLKMKPSDYIRRNVKVSAFEWEPVDQYIKQYGFEDVFCYSSDFPHVEGGTDPMRHGYECVKPLGEAQVKKFFIDNCKWMLPD